MSTLKTNLIVLISASTLMGLAAFADGRPQHKPGPCRQIVQACKKAGFKKGDWKNGDGLWLNCVAPIMGKAPNPKAPALKQGMTVPSVDASVTQACRAKHPNFGMGKKRK